MAELPARMRHNGAMAVPTLVLALLAAAAPVLAADAGFDEKADPAADLAAAVETASQDGRLVLLELGGEWCSWCHVLEQFIADHPKVASGLRATFVVVKVNVSRGNPNREFLSRYPEAPGFPHFIVLASDGTFLEEQSLDDFEAPGGGFDEALMLAFVERWAKEMTARSTPRDA